MANKFKVKVENKNFSGMSHGLMFKGGASEIFDNEELYHRLLAKGYEAVDVQEELEALEEQKKLEAEKLETEIQKRVEARLKEELKKLKEKPKEK